MLRCNRFALVSAITALAAATSALAVTGSTPDGDAHPYVGALSSTMRFGAPAS